MRKLSLIPGPHSAAALIKKKLVENQGKATIKSLNGKSYEIRAGHDGVHFECDQLPVNPHYEYSVFNIMVNCLFENGRKANKGNGRNYKLGDAKCDDTTLVGYLGKHYAKKEQGASVYDPVFVLASILEWAGLVYNQRGYVELTPETQIDQ